MTKELIEKRLADLQKALEQSFANTNMLLGGIEECKHWLQAINLVATSENQ